MMRIVAFALLMLVNPVSARANMLMEAAFEENVRAADLVIIARAVELPDEDRRPLLHWVPKTSQIRVELVLKGSVAKPSLTLSHGAIVEAYPNCCVAGKQYLMILRKTGPLVYESVNGRFGVIEIPE